MGSIVCLQNDNITNTIYCLFTDDLTSTVYLASINQFNGALSIINSIPGLTGIVNFASVFTENNNRYTFSGIDVNQIPQMYTLDATTGNILYQHPFANSGIYYDVVYGLEFDPISSQIYGLLGEVPSGLNSIVSVDPVLGTYAILDSIPGLSGTVNFATVLNYDTGEYSLIGTDNSQNQFIYTFDINTGNLLYQAPMPNASFSGLFYRPCSNNYPLGINNKQIELEIEVYPNPASHLVQLKSNLPILNLTVFNMLGESVYEIENTGTIFTLNISNLNNGVYILVSETGHTITKPKLVV